MAADKSKNIIVFSNPIDEFIDSLMDVTRRNEVVAFLRYIEIKAKDAEKDLNSINEVETINDGIMLGEIPEEENLKERLNVLLQDFPSEFAKVGNCKCKRSIIVFFVPGRKATPIYLGDWSSQRQSIDKRLDSLHRELIRRQFKLLENGDGYDHLFEFTHAFLVRGLSLNKLNMSFMVSNISDADQYFQEEDESRITWKVGSEVKDKFKNEKLLVTGVVATGDSLVIQASYFDHSEDNLNNTLCYLHETFASKVLLKYYAPFIQFNTRSLKKALMATNISQSFLKYSGLELHEKSNFTYEWEDRCCADLSEVIYENLIKKLSTIHETITTTEEKIYDKLKETLNTNGYESLIRTLKGESPPKAGILWRFPDKLPKRTFTQEVEATQRALGIGTRDHVIHPFQTFLLGTLLINKTHAEFLEAIKINFPGYDSSTHTGPLHEEPLLTFLKAAWFVCATMHDIGYPVQVADDLIKTFRDEIGNLLDFRHLPNPSLRIDDAIYSDPRAEWIMRRLAIGLYQIIEPNLSDDFKERYNRELLCESLCWLIKWFTFIKKRHEMASTLAMAMLFLKNSTPSIPVLKQFTKSGIVQLTAIETHILLPIMIHHILDWADDIEEEINSENGAFSNSVIKNMIEPLAEMFDGSINKIINFKNLPLGVLLVICDLFQEWGRPGFRDDEKYPVQIMGVLDGTSSLPELTVTLYYSETDFTHESSEQPHSDYQKRDVRVKRIEKLFDRGPLEKFKAKFKSNIADSDVFILDE